MIRITEVPAFSLPMITGQYQTHKTRFDSAKSKLVRIGLEIFLSEGFRSVWKNCWSEAERIFVETQKDFFEQKRDLYFCKLKTNTVLVRNHNKFRIYFAKTDSMKKIEK